MYETTTATPQRVQCGGGGKSHKRKIRVGVYARVSTSLSSQELSLESQMKAYQQKIDENPDMVLVNVYADEGITGTSARKRAQFLKMISDAEAGKLDTIMTKSISRFARNTVECLQYVRNLKEKGVNIIFEKEGIDTAEAMSEMLLTVLAAFAQEESRSISENLKWGIRKRYEMGKGRWSKLYGYEQDDAKNVLEKPGEADVVRMIFNHYRLGKSVNEITETLNSCGFKSPRGVKWTPATVQGMLQCEKYVGDMLLQKYISTDHISHKCVLNDTKEVPSYYVRNTHPAIVDRRTFDQVQRIMELKAPRGECSRYPYEDSKIICPYCGKPMVTRLMHVQAKKKAVCCFGDDGCHRFSVKTWMLDETLRAAFEELDVNDIEQNGDAAKRMKAMKQEETPETIEYWFLADAVKKVEFIRSESTRMQKHKKRPPTEETVYDWDVKVTWQCGLTTTVPLPLDERHSEEPTHVAELYETYLTRMQKGEYVPTRPKNQRERKMKEVQVSILEVRK